MLRENLSPFEELFDAVFYTSGMYSHFDLSFVPTLGNVSTMMPVLFSPERKAVWRAFLRKDLNNDIERQGFDEIFTLGRQDNFPYKKICQHIKSISSLKIESDLKEFYLYPWNRFVLTLIAANVAGDHLKAYIKKEEERIWLRLAIVLHSNDSVATLSANNVLKRDICEWAARAKNKCLIENLIVANKKLQSKLRDEFYRQVILSGDVEMAKYVLDGGDFSSEAYVIDQEVIEDAALTGSILLFCYLMNHSRRDSSVEIQMEDVLIKAIMSKSLEMIKYLLLNYPGIAAKLGESDLEYCLKDVIKLDDLTLLKFIFMHVFPELIITEDALVVAAKSGNVEVFDYVYDLYLQQSDNDVIDAKSILDAAARSGRCRMVRHIVHKFPVRADQDTLAAAAKSGNFSMLKFFLHPYFHLKPSGTTLDSAMESRNLYILYYLLDPKKGFNLSAEEYPNADFVVKPLLKADDKVRTAFVLIVHDEVVAAKEKLNAAIDLSITHFFRLVADFCINPSKYTVSQGKIELLVGQVEEVLKTKSLHGYSLVDLNSVKHLLGDTSKELNVDGKCTSIANTFSRWGDQFELAAQLKCDVNKIVFLR